MSCRQRKQAGITEHVHPVWAMSRPSVGRRSNFSDRLPSQCTAAIYLSPALLQNRSGFNGSADIDILPIKKKKKQKSLEVK